LFAFFSQKKFSKKAELKFCKQLKKSGKKMNIGFDFGSKNIHYVVLENNKPVMTGSLEHNGDISKTFQSVLNLIKNSSFDTKNSFFGITGNINFKGIETIDPVVASVEANRVLDTKCRNILSIGCESFSLVLLDENFNYLEHSVNSDCASGTGSFMDQQAERLGFETETLSQKAADFKGSEPSIATRCAVFAKSDIIHAQAQGFNPDAIAAGLCTGVTRSVISNTLKGRELKGNVLLTGGMSKNKKIVKELANSLEKQVIVHELSTFFNAFGAAVLGKNRFEDIEKLTSGDGQKREIRKPLVINLPDYPDFEKDFTYIENKIEITKYKTPKEKNIKIYIGIDVGSTSTKAVVTDLEGDILAGLYSRTKGDPVNAVTGLFKSVKNIFSDINPLICGVATTGSGRELIKDVIGADLCVNEITAHAKGSVKLDPQVDTIIEIGGQDSKFTLIDKGVVTQATMNYVCAAGTGSFIEEQAIRLGMELSEISDAVEGKKAPFTSDRCTVYMERDLNIFLSEGWDKKEIMGAVLNSVCDNYLSKVVGKSQTGQKIWFQGATARNKALVAVFQNKLGKPVNVSKYCHLTGAIGCVINLMEKKITQSSFEGIDFTCKVESEICTLCHNRCELRVYTTKDRKTAWGLKCGRDYNDNKVGKKEAVSAFEKSFYETFKTEEVNFKNSSKPVIGIPETLYMVEYLPMFQSFFNKLGFNVIIEKSSAPKLSKGMAMINADFCAPMALSHGMVESLYRKNPDFIFLPTIINEQSYTKKLDKEELFRQKDTDSYFCYYSSYAGSIINFLPGFDFKNKILHPKLRLNNTTDEAVGNMLSDSISEILSVKKEDIVKAYIESRLEFMDKKKNFVKQGKSVLNKKTDKPKILLLGRPYTLFDKRINLGIPAKLESMGFDILSQSMLDLENEDKNADHLENMHWYFGQQILLALESVRKNRDLYPIFLTCFRCSPDSYLINYFKDYMEKAGKPYLILQLDEHSSDVGYMTRIEAAIDTFVSDFNLKKTKTSEPQRKSYSPDSLEKGDRVLIPMTDKRINSLQKAVFEGAGFDAEICELDREMLNTGYRYVTGGECLPNVAIAGSVISTMKNKNYDPEKTVIYLPNLCLSCNFNQYANLIKLSCANAGAGNIKIMNKNGLEAVPGLPARSNAYLLSVTFLSSILNKLKFRYLPYEKEEGKTIEVVEKSEEIIRQHILNKKSLFKAAEEIKNEFLKLPLPDYRKPRIGILGDMYAKYNHILNDDICDYAQKLGGEILLPSYNELMLHTAHSDVVEFDEDPKLWKTMAGYESKFEEIFKDILDETLFEPDLDECHELMKEFGFREFITGETTISTGRLLYYIKHKAVDAVIHVNPVFCCPGVISSSLFRKIQEEFNIPVINLFYDGTNKPNKMIVPHMFYLNRKAE
jgi:predicted CoA-substrate-specific enzyme activase